MKAFLALVILLVWTGVAWADACFIIDRKGSWMNELKQGEVNQMISAGTLTQEEYDARSLPFDLVSVVDATKCADPGTTGNNILVVVVSGLSLADAQQYIGPMWEMTGEVDGNNEPIWYVKYDSKHGFKNVPQNVMNVIGEVDYFESAWGEICGYINNKMTDLTGAMCP